MAHFQDLAPCAYFGEENTAQLVAVGWLEREHDYARGEIDDAFAAKLVALLVDPWQPVIAMGSHDCDFCRLSHGPRTLCYQGMTVQMGIANLFVPAGGLLYVAPSLIAHYIDAHDYAPPVPFQEAVMACPPMRSIAYLRAIRAHGPPGFGRHR